MKNINVCKVKMVVDHELIELFAHFLLPLELYCKSYCSKLLMLQTADLYHLLEAQ